MIVGNNAKKAVAQGEANNGGMATAGVILGWIAIALSVLGLILIAVLARERGLPGRVQRGLQLGMSRTTVDLLTVPTARSCPTRPRRTGRAVARH